MDKKFAIIKSLIDKPNKFIERKEFVKNKSLKWVFKSKNKQIR